MLKMKKISTLFTILFASLALMTRAQDVTITFQVDMTDYLTTYGPVSANGIHVAGTFQTEGSTTITTDWDPTISPVFTLVSGNIYQADIVFPATSAGDVLQFKFLNNDNWGACDTVQECSIPTDCSINNGNRAYTLPDVSSIFYAMWNQCPSASPLG